MAFDSLLPPSSPFNRRATPATALTIAGSFFDVAPSAYKPRGDAESFAALVRAAWDAHTRIDAAYEPILDYMTSDDPVVLLAEANCNAAIESFISLSQAVLDTPAPTLELAFEKIRLGLKVDPDGEYSDNSGIPGYELIKYVKSALGDAERIATSEGLQ